MTDQDSSKTASKRGVYKRVQLAAQPGKPIQLIEEEMLDAPSPMSAVSRAISHAFKAYRKAATELITGKYSHLREYTAPQLREPCHIYVFVCTDGVLVRYEPAGEQEPKVRTTEIPQSLEIVAPQFSENVVHFPKDISSFVPPITGPGFAVVSVDESGNITTREDLHLSVCASTQLPASFVLQLPGTRPPTLASINNELQMFAHGVESPVGVVADAMLDDGTPFVMHGKLRLQVGWSAIEAYPLLGEDYWQEQFAPLWAEIDILFTSIQAQSPELALNASDGFAAERARYSRIFAEFVALLAGPEEPVHQFLRAHPHLISQTFTWLESKMPFGNDLISDFVFREPHNDYLLVELESPTQQLFTKNGDQRKELNHAIQQTSNWARYIEDNKSTVEHELGLVGIASSPRRLVVIGRSADLTEKNRRTLQRIMSDNPRLTVLTYDDMIARAKANLEMIVGSLSLRAENSRIYYPKSKV